MFYESKEVKNQQKIKLQIKSLTENISGRSGPENISHVQRPILP